jgi:hypothetical protein
VTANPEAGDLIRESGGCTILAQQFGMSFFHRGRTLQLPTGAIAGRSTRRFIKLNSLRRSEVDPRHGIVLPARDEIFPPHVTRLELRVGCRLETRFPLHPTPNRSKAHSFLSGRGAARSRTIHFGEVCRLYTRAN